jgi:hypothetical protein
MTHGTFPPNSERIRSEMRKRIAGHTHTTHTELNSPNYSKVIERLTTLALAHALAVLEHEQYIAHATFGDS